MVIVLLARGKFSLKVLDAIHYLCNIFADPKTQFLFTFSQCMGMVLEVSKSIAIML